MAYTDDWDCKNYKRLVQTCMVSRVPLRSSRGVGREGEEGREGGGERERATGYYSLSGLLLAEKSCLAAVVVFQLILGSCGEWPHWAAERSAGPPTQREARAPRPLG